MEGWRSTERKGILSIKWLLLFFLFLATPSSIRILVSPAGIEFVPPAVEAWILFKKLLFIYLLIFGCVRSSGLLTWVVSLVAEHSFSSCGPGGLVALRHVGSSWIR